MADIEKAIAELQEYHDREWTEERDFPATRETRKRVTGNAIELLTEYKELKDRHETIVKAADDMLAELKERRWIPVSERLPKNYENVIVHQTGNSMCAHVIVGYHYGNDVFESWFAYNGETISCVTHWMPFPEPPRMD